MKVVATRKEALVKANNNRTIGPAQTRRLILKFLTRKCRYRSTTRSMRTMRAIVSTVVVVAPVMEGTNLNLGTF